MLSLKRDELKSSISPALQAAGSSGQQARGRGELGSRQQQAVSREQQWAAGSSWQQRAAAGSG